MVRDPWHAIGILGAAWVIYDSFHANSALNMLKQMDRKKQQSHGKEAEA